MSFCPFSSLLLSNANREPQTQMSNNDGLGIEKKAAFVGIIQLLAGNGPERVAILTATNIFKMTTS